MITKHIFEMVLIKRQKELAIFLAACEEYEKNPTITAQIDDLIITSTIHNSTTIDYYTNLITNYLEYTKIRQQEVQQLREITTPDKEKNINQLLDDMIDKFGKRKFGFLESIFDIFNRTKKV